jgi:hypothetical protein
MIRIDRPIVDDGTGTLRFEENRLVRRLLDEASKRGFGLNELAAGSYDNEDFREEWQELSQLLGYSISGYEDLSYVDDDALDRVDKAINHTRSVSDDSLYKYHPSGRRSNDYQKPTKMQITEAKDHARRLAQLKNACDELPECTDSDHVWYDEEGYIYHNRHCIRCGSFLETL